MHLPLWKLGGAGGGGGGGRDIRNIATSSPEWYRYGEGVEGGGGGVKQIDSTVSEATPISVLVFGYLRKATSAGRHTPL